MTDDEDVLLAENWYDILEVPSSATEDQIKKSYRVKAKIYHPDRNKTPEGGAMFLKVKRALEVLTNEASRKAFDDKLQARLLRKKKRDALDEKTRSMKDDLVARENRAKRRKREETTLKQANEHKINQLREDGRRRMEEEAQLRQEELRRAASPPPADTANASGGTHATAQNHDDFEEYVLQKMMQASKQQQ